MFYFQSYVTKKPTCVILNVNGSPKKINVDKIEKELFNEFDLKEGDIDFEDEEEDSFSSSDEDSL